MDADNSPVRRAVPAQGGTVEPANRAPVAIARFEQRMRTDSQLREQLATLQLQLSK